MCKKSNNHQPTSIGKPSIETEDTSEEDGMIGSEYGRKLLNAINTLHILHIMSEYEPTLLKLPT